MQETWNSHLIPGLGRSPGEGNGYPLLYSDPENSMDCIAHGVAKSRTRLSGFHFDCFQTHVEVCVHLYGFHFEEERFCFHGVWTFKILESSQQVHIIHNPIIILLKEDFCHLPLVEWLKDASPWGVYTAWHPTICSAHTRSFFTERWSFPSFL